MLNFDETIKYIYEKLPMYHKIGSKAYKPGLQNIEKLCEELGNPQHNFNIIHIAGTNGKGSSSHMLSAILQAHGKTTGLFTSPHLKKFTERIKINGNEIDEAFVVKFINQHKSLIEEIQPSFFEITTTMAFSYFSERKVDWAVIETGLGGRLDSTNIVNPKICLITNISYDHMDLLGNTLPEIAFEKAGIIKAGIPIVISEKQQEIENVFVQKAEAEKSPLFFADEYGVENKGFNHTAKRMVNISIKNILKYENLEIGLAGNYQLKNIKGVLKVTDVIDKSYFPIDENKLRYGLSNVVETTGLKGRWQTISTSPHVVCDTGHNEGGIKEILEQIQSIDYTKLFMILGMVKEKEHDKILKMLPKNADYIFTEPKVERKLSAYLLSEKANLHGLSGIVIENVNSAINYAKSIAGSNDLIFVGGSTFVVAEVEGL